MIESSRPGRNEADRVSLIAMHSIVTWCEALSGAVSLQEGLAALVAGLDAEVGVIVRTHMNDLRPVRIATSDLANDAMTARPLCRSFADTYFGSAILRPRHATIWQATAHADDATGDPSLSDWQAVRRMKEFVVLILASGVNTRDHIELHFRNLLCAETKATLASMLPDMARVWTNRRAGLITRTIVNHRNVAQIDAYNAARVSILGADNPLRLSRAEYRVCLLLSRGLMMKAVAKELSLAEPTIRTHLRNIYGKTQCGSLAELVFRLIESKQRSGLPEAKSA